MTGHFLYIETSLPHRADTARLLSPQVDVNPSGACLRFWYIMYGPSVNSLNVYIHADNSTAKVWTRTGTQENQWTFGETLITSYYRCQVQNHCCSLIVVFTNILSNNKKSNFTDIIDICLEQNMSAYARVWVQILVSKS